MNWSAKLTAISFLAVAALGTATFSGCKADSSTSNDTKGGDDDDDDVVGDDDDDTTKTDAGGEEKDGGGGGTCEGNKQQAAFEPAELQSCLESKCCSELKTCFDIADSDDGVGCETYSECMAQCDSTAGDAGDDTSCFDACDAASTAAVKTAYEAILTCATSNSCVE